MRPYWRYDPGDIERDQVLLQLGWSAPVWEPGSLKIGPRKIDESFVGN